MRTLMILFKYIAGAVCKAQKPAQSCDSVTGRDHPGFRCLTSTRLTSPLLATTSSHPPPPAPAHQCHCYFTPLSLLSKKKKKRVRGGGGQNKTTTKLEKGENNRPSMKLKHRPVCNHTTLLSLHGFFSEKVTKPHDVLVTFPGVASLVVDADDN